MNNKSLVWPWVLVYVLCVAVVVITAGKSVGGIEAAYHLAESEARQAYEQNEQASSLIPAPQVLKPKSDPVNDAMSKQALVGDWKYITSGMASQYTFREDGTYAEYLVISSYSYYYDSYGYSYSRSGSAYRMFTQGKYRVKSGVIELYDVYSAHQSAYDTDWFHNDSTNDASSKLMRMGLPKELLAPAKPSSIEFEFIDQNRLRIRDGSTDFDYQWDDETSHDVEIPTHVIPEAEWPKKAVSPVMPVFEDGRIRSVRVDGSDDTPDDEKDYRIEIDKTSKTALLDYAQTLRDAGWSVYEYDDLPSYAKKAEYQISISSVQEDSFDLISTKGKLGNWPTEWLSDEIFPPSGGLIIGEIDTKDWVKNEGISFTAEFDNVDASQLETYIQELDQSGWIKPEYGWEETERTKYVRINGNMYKAHVEPEGTTGNISEIRYWLEYLPDIVWPTEGLPPGFIPPDGCDLLGSIEPEDLENGSFYFAAVPMDDAAVERYEELLMQIGWEETEDSWSEMEMTRTVTYNGLQYKCFIELSSMRDGCAEFRAWFYED